MPGTNDDPTTQYRDTIDWDDYWTDPSEADRAAASPSAHLLLEPFRELLDEWGAPDTYADVGCGTGTTVFDVAERHPATEVVGYDVADPLLESNREHAHEEGDGNVAFEHAELPRFDPDRQFEVVSAFYTLVYVADVERALRTLYAAVEPGGHLVFTYHNRMGRAHYRGVAEDPHEHLGEDSPFDPETFAERFQLLIEGENVLSHDRIEEVLGTRPRSVWSVVGADHRYRAWRHNPFVFVPK
ncbi:class I SAM-dependent methyltransferase [Halomarina oriensis]|uniref:Methyltransferase domain-containing protein n=1 Tax=Halomarina oriensis TaxID=671145 RepID=A0A6B0GV54_9EURY|nr:class I SAM-dependent methyltransferase [Halomarina oriensis]MWG35995.1 methyltransferase domain-containing protein [Halomarina oriensis]